jgi:hypothetical protein
VKAHRLRRIGARARRARPSVAADVARRRLHALRHSRLGRPGGQGDVFNLDAHIAVSADVRMALESRGLSLTDWSISGHTWVFGRRRDPVAVVNEQTWRSFTPRMIDRFQRAYGSYLRSFRGFLATYPPCFALLYRELGRPTLALAATRYEWPFTHDAELWSWLDESLRQGVEDGWLTLAANNRADADYLENYTGLHAPVIPSACSYIAPTYSGRKGAAVVCARSDDFARVVCGELTSEVVPLRSALGSRYRWAQLYEYRALVFIPYNVSVMALFEHYSADAPIYIPARPFLKELAARYPRAVLSSLSFTQVTGRPAGPRTGARDLNDLRDEQVVDWYLDRADFYAVEWMPHIRLFESWSHLDELLRTDDHLAISARMAADKPARLARIASLWDELEWIRRLST